MKDLTMLVVKVLSESVFNNIVKGRSDRAVNAGIENKNFMSKIA